MDISYIITILINSVKPPLKLATTMGTQNTSLGHVVNTTGKQHSSSGENALPTNIFTHKSLKQLKQLLQAASLLGTEFSVI